jgi:hypothetical protein
LVLASILVISAQTELNIFFKVKMAAAILGVK